MRAVVPASLVCAAIALLSAGMHAGTPQAAGVLRVRIETDAGVIVADIDSARAPRTAANFLRYVRDGRYDNGAFYRVVTRTNQPRDSIRIEVIQGGIDRDGAKRLPAIEHETTEQTGLRHEDGTLSMARGRPGSASSEFFIVVASQPSLDFGGRRNPDGQGFAAFGRVVEGMDVVRRIQAMPADSGPPQRLRTVVRILQARVVTR
jgi:peptidyl-prolyl cis-trans isomerase A (cyclophilin A)